MKQSEDKCWLLLPKARPKTVRGVERWHRRLLETAVSLEFEQLSLKASQGALKNEIARYAPLTKDPAIGSVAVMALGHLNALKRQNVERLREVAAQIKIVHDTNEVILRTLLRAHGAEEVVRSTDARGPAPGANLLHGLGWLYEVASADYLSAQGSAAFVTFGSVFDPAGFDVIAFPRSQRRVRLDFLAATRGKKKGRPTGASSHRRREGR